MSKDPHNNYIVVLDRVLDVLRQELRANPELAKRLVQAVGSEVVFDAEHLPALFDPIEAAAFSSETHFKTTASELGLADLKRIMRQWNLATPVDMRGLKKDAIVAMMYDRAVLKIAERGGATG